MNKKLLISFIIIITVSFKLSGQCIPDNTITAPGIYPDSLPHALVGTAYSGVLQFRIPVDTTVTIAPLGTQPAWVDSVVVTGVAGLPPGYNYRCTPSTCSFAGGTNGCAEFYGPAPDSSMSGKNYPLQVFVTAYGRPKILPNFPVSLNDTVTKYHIMVDSNTGIFKLAAQKSGVQQNYPNPFSAQSVIEFYSSANTAVNFKIANILGKTIYTKSIIALAGVNKIVLNAKDFQPGIYFYTIGSVTHRMIVQ